MQDDKEPTGSQIAGGLIGAVIGNVQGTAVGGAAALGLMALPLAGPLAVLAIPAIFLLPVGGALAGTCLGAKAGSQGLDKALLMLLGSLPKCKL